VVGFLSAGNVASRLATRISRGNPGVPSDRKGAATSSTRISRKFVQASRELGERCVNIDGPRL